MIGRTKLVSLIIVRRPVMRNILIATLIALQSGPCLTATAQTTGAGLNKQPALKIEADIRNERSSYFELRTSKAAWAKICGRRDSYCGEPEGLAYTGPRLLLILPAVWIADILVGIGTVPYDVLSAPFRERRVVPIAHWRVSGQLADSSGPLMGHPVKVRVSVMPPHENAWSLGGQTISKTDDSGSFSAVISGPGPSGTEDRIDVDVESTLQALKGKTLARVCCPNATHPEETQ
jgi:hypothetical protein